MNQREKVLAIAVAICLGLGVIYFGGSSMLDGINRLSSQLKTLEKKQLDNKAIMDVGLRDRGLTKQYLDRSVHPKRTVANSMYRDWLLAIVTKSELSDPVVKAAGQGRLDKSKLFHLFAFDVTGRGDLQQITRLLFDFYSVDHLHRIRRLHMKPVGKSKNIELVMSIELMSLLAAPPRTERMVAKSTRLNHKDMKTYVEQLVNRNFFRVANIAPAFTSSSVPSATIGQRYSHTLKASDADKEDALKFAIAKAPADFPVEIDPSSGRLSIRPKKLGEFLVSVRVTDNGLPAKSKIEEFRFRVQDPPPPPKRVVKKEPPKFDTAKLAFVTAIIEADGRQEVWVNLRNEDRTLRLHKGDPVQIGLLDGKITNILPRKVEITKDDGKVILVSLGKSLSQVDESSAGE